MELWDTVFSLDPYKLGHYLLIQLFISQTAAFDDCKCTLLSLTSRLFCPSTLAASPLCLPFLVAVSWFLIYRRKSWITFCIYVLNRLTDITKQRTHSLPASLSCSAVRSSFTFLRMFLSLSHSSWRLAVGPSTSSALGIAPSRVDLSSSVLDGFDFSVTSSF